MSAAVAGADENDGLARAWPIRSRILAGRGGEGLSARDRADPAGGATAALAAGLDLVFVEGFEGETVIGINDDELLMPQPLRIDVTVGLRRLVACRSDQITDTVGYDAICDALRALMRNHRYRLLEAFAERIAQLMLEDFGACWVRVVVVKPRKFADVSAVGVALERARG